jgi:hypothetical protein
MPVASEKRDMISVNCNAPSVAADLLKWVAKKLSDAVFSVNSSKHNPEIVF